MSHRRSRGSGDVGIRTSPIFTFHFMICVLLNTFARVTYRFRSEYRVVAHPFPAWVGEFPQLPLVVTETMLGDFLPDRTRGTPFGALSQMNSEAILPQRRDCHVETIPLSTWRNGGTEGLMEQLNAARDGTEHPFIRESPLARTQQHRGSAALRQHNIMH